MPQTKRERERERERESSRTRRVIAVSAFITLFFLAHLAHATTYYVDNVGGLDTNNGISSSTPWQTIAKVNSSTFNPGDNILFKAGDTWREGLIPPSSGASGTPITFSSYGGGANPVISGSDLISTWSIATSSYISADNFSNLCSGSDPYWGNCSGNIVSTSTTVVAPGATQSEKLTFASSSASGFVLHSVTSTSVADFQFQLDVASMTASAGATAQLKGITQSSGGMNLATPIVDWQSSSTYTLSLMYYADGNFTLTGTTTLSTNTWYTIEIQYVQSATAGGAALWINGVPRLSSFTNNTSGLAANQIRAGLHASSAGFTAGVFYLDNVKYNTAYIGIPISNTYMATVDAQPNEVWIDGASLGPSATSSANLSTQNQWFSTGDVLYIYSASNPSSGHTVEAADRTYPVYVNQVNYITLNDLEVNDANNVDVYLRDSTYATLQSMKIHDAYGQGVYIGVGGGGHTIENSTIYNTGFSTVLGTGSGIQTDTSLTIPSTFQNNYIYNSGTSGGSGDHGIYDQSPGDITRYNLFYNIPNSTAMKIDASSSQIYGNVFNAIPSGGIYIDSYSNVKVYNNTFYNVGTVSPFAAVSFTGDGGESGVSVENNIDYTPGSSFSVFLNIVTNATGFSSDYNDVFGSGIWWAEWLASSYNSLASFQTAVGLDEHSTSSNPHLVSASTNEFWLASSSPAIDAGLSLGSTYDMGLDPASTWPSNIILDNENSYGSGWDIGAYVYTQTSTPAIAWLSPSTSSTVSGSVTLSASSTAVSPASISSIQFYLDGSPLGSPVTSTSSPNTYSYSWDTTQTSNTSHTLYALATDNYGNTASSSPITLTVYNIPPTPPPPAGYPQSYFIVTPVATSTSSTTTTTSSTSTSTATSTISTSTVTVATSIALSTSSLQTELDTLLAELQSLEAQAGNGSSNVSSSYLFTANLELSDTGSEIHELQNYLIQEDKGSAAQALEIHGTTNYFGILTYNALVEFQESVGIVPASGFFGPITRAWVNGHE